MVLPPSELNVTISELRATLQGAVYWRIQIHDPKATFTLQGAAAWRIECRDPRATLEIVVHRILFFS